MMDASSAFFYSCASAATAAAAAVGDEDKIQLKLNWNGVDQSMNGHPLLRGVSIYTAPTLCVCVCVKSFSDLFDDLVCWLYTAPGATPELDVQHSLVYSILYSRV
jgi:hypothetical protein